MKQLLFLALTTLCASAALAAPGGPLRTLERGNYECATPGVAGGDPVVVREDLPLKVINGSSYRLGEKRGTYLHTGNRVVFTTGGLEGMRFRRVSQSMIQEVDEDGILGDLRCVKRGR